MGLRCNSEKDRGDGRSTNILFLIVPALGALCALPGGGEHRTPCEAETYLQTKKKKKKLKKEILYTESHSRNLSDLCFQKTRALDQ